MKEVCGIKIMKVIFEFDDESEKFDLTQLKKYQNTEKVVAVLGEILQKIRGWEKYDDREVIPVDEVSDTIWNIIKEEGLDVRGLGIW